MAIVIRKQKEPAILNTTSEEPNVFEVLSVWYVDGAPYLTVNLDVWKDPSSYGTVLADLARHIAHAYGQSKGGDKQEMLRSILEEFNAEIEFPTDGPASTLTS